MLANASNHIGPVLLVQLDCLSWLPRALQILPVCTMLVTNSQHLLIF
jgi:hypothetical protein